MNPHRSWCEGGNKIFKMKGGWVGTRERQIKIVDGQRRVRGAGPVKPRGPREDPAEVEPEILLKVCPATSLWNPDL